MGKYVHRKPSNYRQNKTNILIFKYLSIFLKINVLLILLKKQ